MLCSVSLYKQTSNTLNIMLPPSPNHMENQTQIQQTRPADHISPTMAATQQQAPHAKWSGKATSAELKGLKPDQIWPLWADFSNFHNWFPKLDTCRLVEGEPGRIGSVRLCVGKAAAAEEEEMWGKERLVEMDEEKRLMRYEVMENNVGLKGYVAAITVVEVEGGGGCRVEWSFEAEAAEGWEEEALKGYIESSLESIVKKMEEALLSH